MAKKNHMTKHEYVAYKRRYRYEPSLDGEGEDGKHTKSKYITYRKKSDTEMKKRLRNIQEYSDDILDEEYDEYGATTTKIIWEEKPRKTRIKELECYDR